MLVALTITATNEAGGEIRLADAGKSNAAELSRIQQVLAELPAVEILRLDDPPKRIAIIPQVRLVGWVNDQEILLVENDQLVAFNLLSSTRRVSRIKVIKPYYAFLR